MLNNIQKFVKDSGVRLFLIDVDGTLKDLVLEHMMVIKEMIRMRVNQSNEKIYEIVIWLNSFFMTFVKIGIFPTNKSMQTILCLINSMFFGETFEDFKTEYFSEYDRIRQIFDNSYWLLDEIEKSGAKYLLVSKNSQSVNFFSGKCIYIKKPIVVCDNSGNKLDAFKKGISMISCSDPLVNYLPEQILIIGDNFWDDVIPAMKLNARVLWCNKYDSKLKRLLNFHLITAYYEKALDNSKENSIW